MKTGTLGARKPGRLIERLARSVRKSGHDIQSVCRLTGIEAGQIRFLETEFGQYFSPDGGCARLTTFDDYQVELIQRLHQGLFVEGRTVSDIHLELQKKTGAGRAPVHIIAVTSGKGGVGKTTLSINLAIAMKRGGNRVLLVDGDMGMGNVHILTRLTPKHTIADVLQGRTAIDEAVTQGPGDIHILCGGSGVSGLADMKAAVIAQLGQRLRLLGDQFDVVVIDTGAGVSSQVLEFIKMADDLVLVTTPDVAAMLDGYGVLKVARESGIACPAHVLINQVDKPQESEMVYERIRACAERYLGDQPQLLGSLKRDRSLHHANRERQPLALAKPFPLTRPPISTPSSNSLTGRR